MPTIIIEGFDNTGKTTLAKRLAEVLGYNYISGGGPEVGTYDGSLQRLQTGMPNKVQDRTWISEIIYGKIIRGKSGISDAEMMKMIQFHRANNIFLIYAKQSYENIMATINDRDQMSGVVEYAQEIITMYNYYMHEKLPIYLPRPMIYNYNTTSLEDIIQALGYLHVVQGDDLIRARKFNLREFNPGGPSLTDN